VGGSGVPAFFYILTHYAREARYIPLLHGRELDPGQVKVVACDGQRSADLYKQATSKLGEVYEGAKMPH